MGETLPRSTLVLPGHGAAYVDPARLAEDIHAHHQCERERVRRMVAAPKSRAELALDLFGPRHKGIHRVLAATEAHAHLNYLRIHEGSVRPRIQDGIEIFTEA